MLQGVLQRRDDNHLLINDRDEFDLRLIGYVRAEDDVIFFGFQITEHFVGDFLRHRKGDIAGIFRIQETAYEVGNIRFGEGKHVGQVDVASFGVGQSLHFVLGNLYFFEYFINMF
ncbi:unknown [Anaerostipes sp. CAG:276]|nr:unknown [Anaerostipes sp. CAG:276]